MTTVTGRSVVQGLEALGIGSGDLVLMHSSLSSMGHVDGGANTVIDALQWVVGREGIVAVPTHTWGTVNARQPVFHVSLSPSIVGVVTEVFRHRAGVVRSLHPTHSVAALGRRASDFVEGHERWSTPCAMDSPYGRLVQESGWVLLLGVDLSVCTLIHGFEEWAELPWVFNREEQLYTITSEGGTLSVPSRRHTDADGFDRDFPALEPLLQSRGLMRTTTIGDALVRLISASGFWDLLAPLLHQHPDLVLAHRDSAASEALLPHSLGSQGVD